MYSSDGTNTARSDRNLGRISYSDSDLAARCKQPTASDTDDPLFKSTCSLSLPGRKTSLFQHGVLVSILIASLPRPISCGHASGLTGTRPADNGSIDVEGTSIVCRSPFKGPISELCGSRSRVLLLPSHPWFARKRSSSTARAHQSMRPFRARIIGQ